MATKRDRDSWPEFFTIVPDYISEFGGDIDVFLINDKSTNDFIRDQNGTVIYYDTFRDAVKVVRKLVKDKIFEKIVLSNE